MNISKPQFLHKIWTEYIVVGIQGNVHKAVNILSQCGELSNVSQSSLSSYTTYHARQ